MRAKGETAAEVRGFATAMRGLARRFELPPGLPAADIVGTGGDGSGSLNLSTGAALLAAACGLPVIKHGNRSVSSKSGSADVLEALGVTLPADPASARALLDATNFTFLFAPSFHPAMKAIAPVRRALGVRTVFNILGPLTNPAAPPFAMIGAFDLPTARLHGRHAWPACRSSAASSCTASRAGTRRRPSGPSPSSTCGPDRCAGRSATRPTTACPVACPRTWTAAMRPPTRGPSRTC